MTPIPHPPNILDVVHLILDMETVMLWGAPNMWSSWLIVLHVLPGFMHCNPWTTRKLSAFFSNLWLTPGLHHIKYILTLIQSFLKVGRQHGFMKKDTCKLCMAPLGCHNENGLVEWIWQTVVTMAWSYMTDMQMPCKFWYWGVWHTIQISNSLPCMVNGLQMTLFELVYGVKPDYYILFWLFSFGYFKHDYDGSQQHYGVKSKSLHRALQLVC